MEKKDLLNAMNDIEDRHILDAQPAKKEKGAGRKRLAALGIAAAACACIAVGAAVWFSKRPAGPQPGGTQGPAQGGGGEQPTAGLSGADAPGGSSGSSVSGNVQGGGNYTGGVFADYAVAQAQYPESLPEPKSAMFTDASGELDGEAFRAAVEAYRAERTGRINGSESYRSGLYPFYGTTMRELLVSDEHINRAYSPLNLYIALSMLSELTGGESRAQLLELLDAHDIEAVRESASALWLANYSDSGLVTSTLANSLWLRQDVDFVPETMH
ncbi:MAG: hypothetical protein K2N94_06870, partial [Lachnospiraceae bacterium]|nr:hypothetical protein [Lachnospiraceae bacterium]